MSLSRGSIGWEIAGQTLAYLEHQTRLLESALQPEVAMSDEVFSFILSHALDHWDPSPLSQLPPSVTVHGNIVDWRHGKNLPPMQAKKELLEWLIRKLRGKIFRITTEREQLL